MGQGKPQTNIHYEDTVYGNVPCWGHFLFFTDLHPACFLHVTICPVTEEKTKITKDTITLIHMMWLLYFSYGLWNLFYGVRKKTKGPSVCCGNPFSATSVHFYNTCQSRRRLMVFLSTNTSLKEKRGCHFSTDNGSIVLCFRTLSQWDITHSIRARKWMRLMLIHPWLYYHIHLSCFLLCNGTTHQCTKAREEIQ